MDLANLGTAGETSALDHGKHSGGDPSPQTEIPKPVLQLFIGQVVGKKALQ